MLQPVCLFEDLETYPLYAPDMWHNIQCCCRYMNGSGSNPDAHVVAYAGAQEKKGLEIAKKLNAENYGRTLDIYCNGREINDKNGIL